MAGGLSVFSQLFGVLPLQLVAMTLCIVLLWKGWRNINLRIIAICFLVVTISSFLLEMLTVLTDYVKYILEKKVHKRVGYVFLAINIIRELAMVGVAAAVIWLLCGYDNGNNTHDKPASRSANFAIVAFLFGLVVSITYYAGLTVFDVDRDDLGIIATQFLIIQLVLSQLVLLSIFYAMSVVIAEENRTISTAKTLWLLMIPVFGAYWMLKVLKLWAATMVRLHDAGPGDAEGNQLAAIASTLVKFSYVMAASLTVYVLAIEFNVQSRGSFETVEQILMVVVNLLALGYSYQWLQLLLGIKRLEATLKSTGSACDPGSEPEEALAVTV